MQHRMTAMSAKSAQHYYWFWIRDFN